MRNTVLFASLALLLSACASTPPPSNYDYGPPPPPAPPQSMRPYVPPPPRAAEGPVRPVKPLSAGALTAQNVEAYTDNEEKELRVALRGSGFLVSRIGDDLVINLPSDPLFGPSAALLSARAQDLLEPIAVAVRRYDSTQIQIFGYTDTSGTAAQNLQVSQARAGAIAKELTIEGVDARRVTAHGFGEARLRFPTGEGVNEPRNRRIEIRITPVVKG